MVELEGLEPWKTRKWGIIVFVPVAIRRNTEPGVVADGPACHGLCRAQPAPSRPAAKRYVRPQQQEELLLLTIATICT